MRRKIGIFLILLVVLMAGYLMAFGLPRAKQPIPVEIETTYFTEPLDEEGYVDYAAAVNLLGCKNVPPELNAVVLLWQTIGPQPNGPMTPLVPDEYWQQLGMTRPPNDGAYYINFEQFLESKIDDHDHRKAILNNAELPPKTSWNETDRPEMAQWLRVNEKALALASEASRRPHYVSPVFAGLHEDGPKGLIWMPLVGLDAHRSLGYALLYRALLRIKKRDFDGAWADLLAAHRLGRLMGQGLRLMDGLCGIALQRASCRATLTLLELVQLDSKRLAGYLRDLDTLGPPTTLVQALDWTERAGVLELLQTVHRHGQAFFTELDPSAAGHFNWGSSELDLVPSMRQANEWYTRFVTALRADDWTQRNEIWGEGRVRGNRLRMQTMEWWHQAQNIFGNSASRGQTIGLKLNLLFFPAWEKILPLPDLTRQDYHNLRVAIALEMYHRHHKTYPASLAPLVPTYLPQLPNNVFDGLPPHYQLGKSGYQLHVNGPNDNPQRTPQVDLADDQQKSPYDYLIVRMHWQPHDPPHSPLSPSGAHPP